MCYVCVSKKLRTFSRVAVPFRIAVGRAGRSGRHVSLLASLHCSRSDGRARAWWCAFTPRFPR